MMKPEPQSPLQPPSDDDETQKVAHQAKNLHVDETPSNALNLNVEGRQTQTPREGFGQLWQKTYTITLSGATVTPAKVVDVLKEHLPDLQPPENRMFISDVGIEAGEVVLINATTPGGPMGTGMLVIQADDLSFTLLTPQGHPEAGWIKFSASQSGETTIAQIQSVTRASDPIFEVGFWLFGSTMQEKNWRHVLTGLAEYFDVTASEVGLAKSCLDSHFQWSRVGNIRHNAQLHTLAHVITTPFQKLFQRNKKDTPHA